MTHPMSEADFVFKANEAAMDLDKAFQLLNDLDYTMISVSQAKRIMKAMIIIAKANELLTEQIDGIEALWGFRATEGVE